MKVVGYARVSTEEQAQHGVSLEAQKSRIADYCRLYGLELVETIADPGQSAKNLKRPGVQAVLGKLESGEVEGIVISKLDRLTRSVKDWGNLIEKYFSGKASLFSVADSIDTRSASGKLVLNILVSVSEWERLAISERVTISLTHRKKQGIHCGRQGYGYQMKDGKLVLDEDEQRNIALASSLKASGMSLQQIADEFTKRAIPTKRGGKVWRANTIRNLLMKNGTSKRLDKGVEFWNRDENVKIITGEAIEPVPDVIESQRQNVGQLPSASPKL